MANSSPEKGLVAPSHSSEAAPLTVVQPPKAEFFASLLDDIGKIAESTGEDRSGDLGAGGGGMTRSTGSAQATQMSARDLAIANLPVPAVMQKELQKHIQTEVKKLRKQAKKIARIGTPGAAYRLYQIWKRIHHLNAILAGLVEASFDVVKRLFIRVFIDKQTIQ